MTSLKIGEIQNVDDDGYSVIADCVLELDEREDDRAEYASATELALMLQGRENRIGIAARKPVPVVSRDLPTDRAAYDIGLMLVVHAHPECRFVWSSLVVDLAATPEAIITDMTPAEVEDRPVEVETTVGAGLKFSTVLRAVDIELQPELARKRTVYFPTMTASGTGFHKAYWYFSAYGGNYLHANRELRLLVTAPAKAPVIASFAVRARLGMHGVRNIIPMRGRKGSLDSTVTLVPASTSGQRTGKPRRPPRRSA